ncbi:MAG: deoxyhypusine synthase family protein [Candidatus Omnitrophica bacterium]|nr:deoxyhypusine synthase family protein [Candidatus Omnitrophota bacterium]
MEIKIEVIEKLYNNLEGKVKERLEEAIEKIVAIKKKGGKLVVVTGSGPNVHEGVTTLIAELINKGIVDGVSTSSAVIAHEMAGSLEKVKRFDGVRFGFKREKLPLDGIFEVAIMDEDYLNQIKKEITIDEELLKRMLAADGKIIIKVAGNVAYPTGLRTEKLAKEIESIAKRNSLPLEEVAGTGADIHTMIGAGFRKKIPVLVSVPQLIGGGAVGLAIGDSISLTERTRRMAKMLSSAEIIIESALALSQEIHDGPFELTTGHGIWADWQGEKTYSLKEKTIVRIDLDPNLEKAWQMERKTGIVAEAIDKGLPKTKVTKVPFRMEMSGFSRLPHSIPLIGDIGEIWPIIAYRVAKELNINLGFISYKQTLPEGMEMREWIVKNVKAVNREKIYQQLK